MSTIKVRSMQIDHIGYRTVRLLYNGLPSVRSLVHNWFDGDPAFLLKRENREFLRRLVVRSLKELQWSESHGITDCKSVSAPSNEEVGSYGGTSSDEDNSHIFHEDDFDLNGPFVFIRCGFLSDIGAEVGICTRCQTEMNYVTTVRSLINSQFSGVCSRCSDSLNESELLQFMFDTII